MSADFRPIDHIIANVQLKHDGKIEEYLMEHPYIEFHMKDGSTRGLNDKEGCEKYPYVSFFSQDINEAYRTHKEDARFNELCERLESTLRELTDKIAERCEKCFAQHRTTLDLSGVFDNTPEEFPYLEDFMLSRNDFEFAYDSRASHEMFFERFMNTVEMKVQADRVNEEPER